MKTVYKYVFKSHGVIEEFEMPRLSVPLCVNMQNGKICMWASVETDNPIEKRKFCVVGTGHEEPKGCGMYIGSIFPDPFVFHIFMYKKD